MKSPPSRIRRGPNTSPLSHGVGPVPQDSWAVPFYRQLRGEIGEFPEQGADLVRSQLRPQFGIGVYVGLENYRARLFWRTTSCHPLAADRPARSLRNDATAQF